MKQLLILSLTALLGAGALGAQPMHDRDDGPEGEMCCGENGERHMERMARELNLTKEQQAKAKAMREKREPAMKAQMEKMKPLHEELRKLLEAEKVDLAAVKSKLQAISAVQVEMRMLHIQGRLEFESILTAEQKAKMREMHKQHMDRMRDRMKDEKGRGPRDDRSGPHRGH